MKVLFINGGCLTVNSSANLCHIAYIKGLIENGHEVTVFSTSQKGQIIDESIQLPEGATYKYFERSVLYRFINPTEWKGIQSSIQNDQLNFETKIIKQAKKTLQKLYGPFGYNGVWVKNVVRKNRKHQHFDLIISVSAPVYSHLAAIELIKKKRIVSDRFIEIWEDPWQLDLYNQKVDPKLKELEHFLVLKADKVFYVSPLTAKYQSEMFHDCGSKITWAPLPYYYKDDTEVILEENKYGYFGDYFPVSRNLEPFYQAAKKVNINVDICGSSNNLFEPTDRINIYPRLPLSELKEHENGTNILVFLCNLKGGQIPGKIYQYSATRKKILFILDGTEEEISVLEGFFQRFNRYYFCKNNVDDIVKAINRIEKGNDNGISNNVIEEFSPSNTIRSIIDASL